LRSAAAAADGHGGAAEHGESGSDRELTAIQYFCHS
jgi:hypothetical protein